MRIQLHKLSLSWMIITDSLNLKRCWKSKNLTLILLAAHVTRFDVWVLFCFRCRLRYRFLELYYRRAETTHKSGRVVPARVETVILFLPDVWSCVPTRLEWDALKVNFKKQLERKLLRAVATNNPDGGDSQDNANDADEANVADQKALPTSLSSLTLNILLLLRIFHRFTIIYQRKENKSTSYCYCIFIYCCEEYY